MYACGIGIIEEYKAYYPCHFDNHVIIVISFLVLN